VPQVSERAAVRHPLQAWIEGHYARDRGIPREANPHQGDKTMAGAWSDGWICRDYLSRPRARS
jgi:hypothetical protein